MPRVRRVISSNLEPQVIHDEEFILHQGNTTEEEEDEQDDQSESETEDEEEHQQLLQPDEDEDEDYLPLINTNGRISPNTRLNPARRIVFEEHVDELSSSSGREQGGDGNDATDTISCPICMEVWSSQGKHQVCCLPCGHVYGFSCIEKWIQQCKRNSAKCPQCSKKCVVKDIIKLYVSRIAVVDGEQQKKVISLQAENEFLKMKIASLQEKISQDEERMSKEEASCLENSFSGETWRDSQAQMLTGHTLIYGGQGSPSCSFALEDEFVVDGARIFDMDASNQILILARRLSGSGGDHVLTKISLMYPYDSENIQLPPGTKTVKDLHVSPCAGKLALFASLGKKLSILSMESNNVVLTYDLPGPAWSCSWDLNSPHHLYAGLQNGMLLVFDMRQTARPLESINGLSCYPVHTIHSLATPCDVRTLLSASSIGPCVWSTGNGVGDRPFLVPGLENQGVCISLAYSTSIDDMVASFRPRVQVSNEVIYSQPPVSPSPAVLGRGTLGSHVLIKSEGRNCYKKLAISSANVNDVRMLKSAIVKIDNCNPLLAYGDELTRGLSLHDLPSLRLMHTLKPHQHPILDIKYAASLGRGILGCISEDRLQLFSAKIS